MTNRRNSGGVVEDIWINTQVGIDEDDHISSDTPARWKDIEDENALLNPDEFSMEWRG